MKYAVAINGINKFLFRTKKEAIYKANKLKADGYLFVSINKLF